MRPLRTQHNVLVIQDCKLPSGHAGKEVKEDLDSLAVLLNTHFLAYLRLQRLHQQRASLRMYANAEIYIRLSKALKFYLDVFFARVYRGGKVSTPSSL